mgnify:CR=1 FL=1
MDLKDEDVYYTGINWSLMLEDKVRHLEDVPADELCDILFNDKGGGYIILTAQTIK